MKKEHINLSVKYLEAANSLFVEIRKRLASRFEDLQAYIRKRFKQDGISIRYVEHLREGVSGGLGQLLYNFVIAVALSLIHI